MSLDTIVVVTISATTLTPSRTGFGTPLLAGFFATSVFPERVRTYSGTAGMLTDGFLANDPIVRAAGKIFAQSPHPTNVKIGRRANAPDQAGRIKDYRTGDASLSPR